MSTPALTLVAQTGERVTHPTGEIPPDAPSYGQALALLAEQEDKLAGYRKTVDKQARDLGRLEREVERYAKAEEHHPRSQEISELIDYWRTQTHHEKSKASKDRVDLIKARLKDGYTVEQIRWAIDGLAARPFVVNAQRRSEGKPSQRYDQLKHALKGGEALEQFANFGAQARRA